VVPKCLTLVVKGKNALNFRLYLMTFIISSISTLACLKAPLSNPRFSERTLCFGLQCYVPVSFLVSLSYFLLYQKHFKFGMITFCVNPNTDRPHIDPLCHKSDRLKILLWVLPRNIKMFLFYFCQTS